MGGARPTGPAGPPRQPRRSSPGHAGGWGPCGGSGLSWAVPMPLGGGAQHTGVGGPSCPSILPLQIATPAAPLHPPSPTGALVGTQGTGRPLSPADRTDRRPGRPLPWAPQRAPWLYPVIRQRGVCWGGIPAAPESPHTPLRPSSSSTSSGKPHLRALLCAPGCCLTEGQQGPHVSVPGGEQHAGHPAHPAAHPLEPRGAVSCTCRLKIRVHDHLSAGAAAQEILEFMLAPAAPRTRGWDAHTHT